MAADHVGTAEVPGRAPPAADVSTVAAIVAVERAAGGAGGEGALGERGYPLAAKHRPHSTTASVAALDGDGMFPLAG